jgi:N-glycosidase YbiA
MTDPQVIHFYRVNEPYGQFSNFSRHPIFLDGATWPTSEHFFQAQKFLSQDIRTQIQVAPSPMAAAKLGRTRDWPLRADWEQVKDDIMRKAVQAKVLQHADVRQLLLDTGDALLVEHTGNDAYWADGGDGSGKNMLGRILMEIRGELAVMKSRTDCNSSCNTPE